MFTKGNEDYLIMLYRVMVMAKNVIQMLTIFWEFEILKCGVEFEFNQWFNSKCVWLNEPMVWCLYIYTNEQNYYGFIVKIMYVFKWTYTPNSSNNSPV